MPLSDALLSFLTDPKSIFKNITWRLPKNRSSEEHIFIVGAPRSGTTLLQSVIRAHPNITGIEGETGFFMWRDIFTRRYPSLDANQTRAMFSECKDIVSLFDRYAAFIRSKYGGHRMLEKTPQHVFRLSFILRYFPQAKVINILRDGRDCYCSAQNHPNVIQRRSTQAFAKYWKRCLQARRKFDRNPMIMDVQYERLVKHPEVIIKEIMTFLGETYDERQISPKYYSSAKLSKTKQLRKLGAEIDDASVGRWRQEMSKQKLRSFYRIAGQQLKELGYYE